MKCLYNIVLESMQKLVLYSRQYLFECVLLLTLVLLVGSSFLVKGRHHHLSDYSAFRVSETLSCASKIPSPQSFDIGQKNREALRHSRFLRVILHQEEGCIKKDQLLTVAAIKRDHDHGDVIIEKVEFGKIRITGLFLVPYLKLAQDRQFHLQKKLSSSEDQLQSKSFYLIDFELLSEDPFPQPAVGSEPNHLDDPEGL